MLSSSFLYNLLYNTIKGALDLDLRQENAETKNMSTKKDLRDTICCKLCSHILNCNRALSPSLKVAPVSKFRLNVICVMSRNQVGASTEIHLQLTHKHMHIVLQAVTKFSVCENVSENPLK